MKQLLSALFFILLFCALKAQTVLIRDSSVSFNNNDTIPNPEIAYVYTYNEDCLKIEKSSLTSDTIYAYYPDKKLYQTVSRDKLFYPIGSTRITYSYNDTGRLYFILHEQWFTTSTDYEPSTRDSLFYNEKGVQSRRSTDSWDRSSGKWIPLADVSYYYNTRGQLDSTINENFSVDILTKDYYTYTDDKADDYQHTTYIYISGSLSSIIRQTNFSDSADYIRKDSLVYESLTAPDSVFTLVSTIVSTNYFNVDNTVEERDVLTTSPSTDFYSYLKKTFFFYTPCTSVLPVALLNFSGIRQSNNALLKWQTTNETNMLRFDIQRSADGAHFVTVGSLAASGNSSAIKAYTYTDVNVFFTTTSKLYYRLAETDKNGKVCYSKVVTFDIAGVKPHLSITPNPVASGNIQIRSSTSIYSALVKVSDLNGRKLYSSKQNVIAGGIVTIDASSLAKGIYLVTVQSASYKEQLKILKE